MPTQDNSIVHLAKALSRLKKCDHAPYLSNGIINHMLDTLSPELHPYVGWALLNLKYLEWILGPLVRRIPWLNSLVRTTFAVTMIQGGVAHNVLPNTAQANINVRIHPVSRTTSSYIP
jgi:carboxypeptidase PM20D1